MHFFRDTVYTGISSAVNAKPFLCPSFGDRAHTPTADGYPGHADEFHTNACNRARDASVLPCLSGLMCVSPDRAFRVRRTECINSVDG